MKCYTDCEGYFINWNNGNNDIVSIPTLAQAQKWLRKNKKIYVYVMPTIISLCEKYFFIIRTSNGEKWEINNNHDSPEEALSTGITECFKLLEK